jgi:hypothetical protein
MLDFVKKLFHRTQSKHPDDMNQTNELKAKAQDFVADHSDTINEVADTLQEMIPGEADDKIIDSAQEKLNNFAGNNQNPQVPQPPQQ